MRVHGLMMLAVVVSVGACSDAAPTASASAAPPVEASVETLCAEHGVLEAVCTKCNPALIPVFRAKGDFCDEHGLPMSFCPIHHPERHGRPIGAIVDDGAPPHGTKVRFKTATAADQAGIATVAARVEDGGAHLEVVGQIAYDGTRHARVNVRSPGVVRALDVELGAHVAAGQTLATIASSQIGEQRARRDAAAARVTTTEAQLRREEGLLTQGIASQRDVETARQAVADARADKAMASAALGMVGAGTSGTSYRVLAPIAGTVVTRTATIGTMVSTDETLFEIVDTSRMWAEAAVSERDLLQVTMGQTATVTLDALPDRAFVGAVAFVASAVDPTTRTVVVRVPLANPDGVLRGNMFARVVLALPTGKALVRVPTAAVQRAALVALVFVRLQPDVFEARRVKLGATVGDEVEILEGVAVGEQVATRGAFLLKTETLKGAIGAGCCEAD